MHHGRVGGHPGPRHLLRHRVAHLQRRDHLQVREATLEKWLVIIAVESLHYLVFNIADNIIESIDNLLEIL